MAPELMQTMHVDAADWFTSLDDIYYYGGQSAHEQTARFAHQPADGSEIALSPGDTVGIAGRWQHPSSARWQCGCTAQTSAFFFCRSHALRRYYVCCKAACIYIYRDSCYFALCFHCVANSLC